MKLQYSVTRPTQGRPQYHALNMLIFFGKFRITELALGIIWNTTNWTTDIQ